MYYKVCLLLGVWAACLMQVYTQVLTDEEMQTLIDAPFVIIPIEDEGAPESRSFKENLLSAKRNCDCEGLVCKCCTDYKVVVMTVKSCINVKLLPKEKAFDVYITVAGKKIYSNRIEDIERSCTKIPKLNNVEACLHNMMEEHGKDGFTSCMSLDITYKDTLLANINFHCIKYADKKLEFMGNNKTGKSAVANMTVKSPIELLAKLVKAALNEIEIEA